MRSVRIYFSKTGDAKYISHLDLVRCFNRAVARAGIPIFFTEGFNPRPYMNFAMPLSLGVSGLREIVDMKIDGEMTNDEIYSALSSVMPPDIKILEVCLCRRLLRLPFQGTSLKSVRRVCPRKPLTARFLK